MATLLQNAFEVVNPNASVEAKKLLKFLYEIKGQYTLSGQHNFIATGSKYTDIIHDLTGKYPLVWGSDFSFCYDGDEPRKYHHCGPLNLSDPGDEVYYTGMTPAEARQSLVDQAIQKYREGHIITLMWHACPPMSGDCCDGKALWSMEHRMSREDWVRLTTAGTVLNEAWRRQANSIYFYLNQLKEAKVPILWRPYHEMNGVWFWWCNKKGDNGFKRLWIMMYDYFVNHHHLDNLLWVWNANAPRNIPNDEAYDYADFWPGHNYVDILAADVYRDDWKQSHHDDLMRLAEGKPIALGEVGSPPSLEILENQRYWTWYMPWGNLVLRGKGIKRTKSLFADSRILTRENVIIDQDGEYRIKR